MTKQEALTRLCQLCTKVKDEVYNNSVPTDCFCGVNDLSSLNGWDYQMSEQVIQFIEMSVQRALRNKE